MTWKLVGALLAKHASLVGDNLAQFIASYDPETATQVDRDALNARLHEVVLKHSKALQDYGKAKTVADDLAAQIETDKKASEILIQKFEAKDPKVTEAMLNRFAANLEASKAKLPGLRQAEDDAKDLVDKLQEVVDAIEKNLEEFDAKRTEALNRLQQADAVKLQAQVRRDNQEELNRLAGGSQGVSTGLQALNRAADKAQVEADAANTLADIGDKPANEQRVIDEARQLASSTAAPAGESAADRLRRAASA